MKKSLIAMLLAVAMICTLPAEAQFLKKLGQQVQQSAKEKVDMTTKKQASQAMDKMEKDAESAVKNAGSGASASKAASVDPTKVSGAVYYVNAANGSNRNDGTSKTTAFKDLQKAIDEAPEGATICVAEGNYLGKLDQGFIEVKKYLSLIGGYSSDFSDWNPLIHHTTIRPTDAQAGTSGNHGLMDVYVRGNRAGVVMVNGFAFDKGTMNKYCAPLPDNPVASAPVGCETGRMVLVGEDPICPQIPGAPITQQLLHGDVEGQVIICNCTFVNGYHFGIQMGNIGGLFQIYNNVFVGNRMAACEVRSMNQHPGEAKVDFHHNTVAFSWCRDKVMEDMGYGFRFMTTIDADVHDNIFVGNNFSALDRTYVDADKTKEAVRVTSAWNNLFYANAMDLMLPSGGGRFARVKVAQFEDVDQLKKCENNREEANQGLINALDPAYLKGFMTIKTMRTSSYNANSTANQVNRVFGMNQQGTETNRTTMYANRYPFEKAFALFGAVSGVGAQIPSK